MVCAVSFASVQFYVANFIGPELADILGSLACIGCMVLLLKLWKPTNIHRLEEDTAPAPKHLHSAAQVFVAWLPYLLLVVFVLTWGEVAINGRSTFTNGLPPPFCRNTTGLNGRNVPGCTTDQRVPPFTRRRSHLQPLYAEWRQASGTACSWPPWPPPVLR